MKKLTFVLVSLFFICFSSSVFSQVYYASLHVNNINALIRPVGHHFWDWDGDANYVVPADGSASTIFTSTLWVGGKDAEENLYLCGEQFRQSGRDYYTGPLSYVPSLYLNEQAIADWDMIWEVSSVEISDFLLCNNSVDYPDYVIPESILNWPAHGDVSAGQSYNLAPYFDVNNDGAYNPYDGDYPNIRGHQCLFFIFNDYAEHTETGGEKMGLEIHGMAYAYSFPDDPAFNNATFLNYKIINRSNETYYDTYVGLFTDFDIGFPSDDFIGCDVERGSFYAYNGDDFDETAGGFYGYGYNPPAQSATLLGGPYMDADGIDNPQFDEFENQIVDESINGINFGDGIEDNERLGMTGFSYFSILGNGANPSTVDPYVALDYYNYMTGKWLDGTQLCYGGTGHLSGGGDTEIPAKFAFPGNPTTDPLGWGTNGVPQAAWSEETEGNATADRRGMCSSGPFTFESGDTAHIDIAFVYGVAIEVKSSSVDVMKQNIDIIRAGFRDNLLPDGTHFIYNDISEQTALGGKTNISIYPNPCTDILRIKAEKFKKVDVFSIDGKFLFSTNKKYIDMSVLEHGLYLIKITTALGEDLKTIVKQ